MAGWLVERRLSEGTADSRGFTLLLLAIFAAAVLLPSIYGVLHTLRENPSVAVTAPQVSTPPVPQVVFSEPSATVLRGLAPSPFGGGFLERGWRSVNLGGICQLQRWVLAGDAFLVVNFHWQRFADEDERKRRNPSLTMVLPWGSFGAGTRVTVESLRLEQPIEPAVMPPGAVIEDREVVELLKGEPAKGGSWTVRVTAPNAPGRSFEVKVDGFNVAAAMFDACVSAASKDAD